MLRVAEEPVLTHTLKYQPTSSRGKRRYRDATRDNTLR